MSVILPASPVSTEWPAVHLDHPNRVIPRGPFLGGDVK